MQWMNKFWDIYYENHKVIQEHERLNNRLQENLHEIQSKDAPNTTSTSSTKDLIEQHQKYYDQLKTDAK